MPSPKSLLTAALVAAALSTPPASAQELPLAPARGGGQGVWPVFEGWYDRGDGNYVIYFGYYNRNHEQAVEVPLGERNFVEPRELDGGQPTRFEPDRDWGVFSIVVPADYPRDSRIYWNLVIGGQTYRVPGHLHTDWKTDALGGGAAGNSPPVLSFGSAQGSGPGGVTAPSALSASVGRPLEIRLGASDPGAAGGSRVTLTWFKHQGPGGVTFSPATARVNATGGEATTSATFDAPGEYVLRVRATDAGIAMAGHAQCCWTNGYVKVTVR